MRAASAPARVSPASQRILTGPLALEIARFGVPLALGMGLALLILIATVLAGEIRNALTASSAASSAAVSTTSQAAMLSAS